MSEAPDVQRTTESADMIETPTEDDPADLAGSAASGTAEKMHDEVDEIAEGTGATTPGHGPDQS